MAEEKAKKTKKEKIPRQPMPEQAPEIRAKNFDEVRFKKGVHFPYKNGTSYYMNFNGSLLCVPNDSHNIKEYEIIKALDIIKNPEILEEKIKKVEILMLDKL